MKRNYQTIVTLLMFFIFTLIAVAEGLAQAPDGFNYQAAIREGDGSIRANDAALIRFTIADDANGTTVLYQETATLTTDQYGLVDHVIGQGTVVSGNFTSINWGNGQKFLKVELNGNAGFTEISNDELQSVPFSQFAAQADYNSLSNKPTLFDGDYNSLSNKPTFSTDYNNLSNRPWITSGSNLYSASPRVGIGLTSPTAPVHIQASSQNDPNNNGLYVNNTRTTSTSDAIVAVRTQGANSGDPFISFDINGVSGWSAGIDNSDADKFKIANSWSTLTSSTRFTIDGTGKFGFGSSGPSAFMDVLQPGNSPQDGIRLYRNTNNRWEIYHSGSFLSFANNGTRVAYIQNGTGSYTQVSDSTLKTEIKELGTILDKVNLLKPVSYRYKGKKGNSPKTYGFLAQEVGVVFPEMVKTAEDGSIGLSYSEFSIIAIKAIQEQQAQIELLRKELDEKVDANQSLQERLEAIEAKLVELSKAK